MGFLSSLGLGRKQPPAVSPAKPPSVAVKPLPPGWGAVNPGRASSTPPKAVLDAAMASLKTQGVPVKEVVVSWVDNKPGLVAVVATEKDQALVPRGAFQGYPVTSRLPTATWSPPDPNNPW